jgi:endonuclease/exonuclease/phosphatase family metal-dependent hydrolase
MVLANKLNFAWWNLQSFAHYDPAKISLERHPKRQVHYEAKRDRILGIVSSLIEGDTLDLFACCEITREAALDIKNSLPGKFDVHLVPRYPGGDDFQVAVFYRNGVGLTAERPLVPTESEDVTRETRPMLPIHLSRPGHIIRFVACHWTAFDEARSRVNRARLADFLRRDTYEFLFPEAPNPGVTRSVVILGDLNEEPMASLFIENLAGSRDRRSSRGAHWRDHDVRLVRLYNLAWRFLGEQVPHGVARPVPLGSAGTCYNAREGWRTFDHVLVSGDLLGDRPPYIDEENARIFTHASLQDEHGRPGPFEEGRAYGVSDHLPIVGRLFLPETET